MMIMWGSYGFLRVAGIEVSAIKNGMPSEMLALFTDNMLRRRETRAADHYSDASLADQPVQVYELVAPGRVIADRLEVFGFQSAIALA
jgi:HEPN/Toprim N-terminal domain 1